MRKYVKIRLTDRKGRVLQHFFVRSQKWRLPSGLIEKGEAADKAAARELFERTGYKISPRDLTYIGTHGVFYMFKGKKANAKQDTMPGECGGYSTHVRWAMR